jgi:hypothetical protein
MHLLVEKIIIYFPHPVGMRLSALAEPEQYMHVVGHSAASFFTFPI